MAASQTRTLRSRPTKPPPETTRAPSGLKSRLLTQPPCSRKARGWPPARSQVLTSRSVPPEARRRPSGWNARAITKARCPRKVASGRPVSVSQRTDAAVLARRRPGGGRRGCRPGSGRSRCGRRGPAPRGRCPGPRAGRSGPSPPRRAACRRGGRPRRRRCRCARGGRTSDWPEPSRPPRPSQIRTDSSPAAAICCRRG